MLNICTIQEHMIMDVEVHECVSEYAEYMYDWFMSGKQEIRKQIMIMDSCKTMASLVH